MAVTGIVKVTVDGVLTRSKEGAKLIMGGMEQTSHMGHSYYGRSKKLVPGRVEFTIVHTSDTDLKQISEWDGVVVEFETDTGKTYIINNAGTTKVVELTGDGGEVPVEMEGEPAVEK